MQQTLQRLGSISSMNDVPVVVNALRKSLGLNDVTLTGVPRTTHFAHVLTEADYRMKLIGIGLEAPPVPMITYVSRLAATPANALIRWYFVPDYEAIACSPDGHAMQLWARIEVIGEDEFVNSDGTRKARGRSTNPASKAYTTDFTKKFDAVADNSPVYGQLRNLVDFTIAAAFIQDRQFYQDSGWNQGVLGSEDQLSVEVLRSSSGRNSDQRGYQRQSLDNSYRWRRTHSGEAAIKAENIQGDEDGSILKAHDTDLNAVPADNWWWD